jgi:alpha-D-ribose 1-methylphosphonate 5-triphosphate synthase subunit PhnL
MSVSDNVLLLGLSGTGKTSLLRFFAAKLAAAGHAVLIVDTHDEISGDQVCLSCHVVVFVLSCCFGFVIHFACYVLLMCFPRIPPIHQLEMRDVSLFTETVCCN